MESVDCGVDEDRFVLSYNRTAAELAPCQKSDFSFDIEPTEGDTGMSVAVFRIRLRGEVLRENRSQPFRTGALTQKDISVNKTTCVVKLKKHDASIDLKALFN